MLRDRRGAAAMEFGLIAPVFLLCIMGMLDLGHGMYVKAMLQGAVQKAGRDSMLESGPTSSAAIDAKVIATVKQAVPTGSFVTVRRSYDDFRNIGKPEPFVDTNNNGVRDAGECFQDINNNGRWDNDSSSIGQGGASDAVVYTVTVTYAHFFPMISLMAPFTGGQSSSPPFSTMSATTVLRNQPYANQSDPPIICN